MPLNGAAFGSDLGGDAASRERTVATDSSGSRSDPCCRRQIGWPCNYGSQPWNTRPLCGPEHVLIGGSTNAPRILQPLRGVSEYYPPASLRSGETGRVVLVLLFNAAVFPGAGLFLPEIAGLTAGTGSVRPCARGSPQDRATTLSAFVAPVPRTAGHLVEPAACSDLSAGCSKKSASERSLCLNSVPGQSPQSYRLCHRAYAQPS